MTDIINKSAENKNNLSEEEYKTTMDEVGGEELELMKKLLKNYKYSKELLRIFDAFGKARLEESMKSSERISRCCVAFMEKFLDGMEDFEKQKILATFGAFELVGDILFKSVPSFYTQRKSN